MSCHQAMALMRVQMQRNGSIGRQGDANSLVDTESITECISEGHLVANQQ